LAESDLYRARKRTRLALLAGQSPHVRSALKKRLDYLTTSPAGCAYNKNLHRFLTAGPFPLLNLIRIKIAIVPDFKLA
jgi:hypothetical protein